MVTSIHSTDGVCKFIPVELTVTIDIHLSERFLRVQYLPLMSLPLRWLSLVLMGLPDHLLWNQFHGVSMLVYKVLIFRTALSLLLVLMRLMLKSRFMFTPALSTLSHEFPLLCVSQWRETGLLYSNFKKIGDIRPFRVLVPTPSTSKASTGSSIWSPWCTGCFVRAITYNMDT